jgi:sigma-B regulation protein RsbU (phosphoserine phosphatase)
MSEKICIVDDNLVNRRLLAGILKKEGYQLLEAEDGEEAIELTLKELPDLVLLDIMMPKKDGYQVCEELKRDRRSAHIPIIFLSAKTQVEDKIKGLDLGGADYVTKPFDRGEVLARVRAQLNIARLTKEVMEANEELMRKQRRLNEDLEAAAGIQQSLLPQGAPDMENVAVAWRFMPCESIGGDIFNVIRLDETHWAIYMLDVSGHGVPSALVTVSVSQMLHPNRGLLLRDTESCRGSQPSGSGVSHRAVQQIFYHYLPDTGCEGGPHPLQQCGPPSSDYRPQGRDTGVVRQGGHHYRDGRRAPF